MSKDRGDIQEEWGTSGTNGAEFAMGSVVLVPIRLDKVQKCEFVAKLITVKKVAKTNQLKLVS